MQKYVTDLPDELIGHIFSFLDFLTFTYPTLSTLSTDALAEFLPVCSPTTVDFSFIPIFKYRDQLKTRKTSTRNKLLSAIMQTLKTLVKRYPTVFDRVTVLNCNHMTCLFETYELRYEALLPLFPNVETLLLVDACTKYVNPDKPSEEVQKILSMCKKLRVLDITHCNWNDKPTLDLSSKVVEFSKIYSGIATTDDLDSTFATIRSYGIDPKSHTKYSGPLRHVINNLDLYKHMYKTLRCCPNEEYLLGTTPLSEAIYLSKYEIVEYLIENGANLSYVNHSKGFSNVTAKQSFELFREMLTNGKPRMQEAVKELIRARDGKGNTILHYCADFHQALTVEIDCFLDGNTDVLNDNDETALDVALNSFTLPTTAFSNDVIKLCKMTRKGALKVLNTRFSSDIRDMILEKYFNSLEQKFKFLEAVTLTRKTSEYHVFRSIMAAYLSHTKYDKEEFIAVLLAPYGKKNDSFFENEIRTATKKSKPSQVFQIYQESLEEEVRKRLVDFASWRGLEKYVFELADMSEYDDEGFTLLHRFANDICCRHEGEVVLRNQTFFVQLLELVYRSITGQDNLHLVTKDGNANSLLHLIGLSYQKFKQGLTQERKVKLRYGYEGIYQKLLRIGIKEKKNTKGQYPYHIMPPVEPKGRGRPNYNQSV